MAVNPPSNCLPDPNRFIQALDALEDGVLCLDDQERLVFLNASAQSLLGIDRNAAFGRPVTELPWVAELLVQIEWEVVKRAPSPLRVMRVIQGRGPGGDIRQLGVTIHASGEDANRLFVITLRDVARQHQFEHAFNESQKAQAISALAAGIAHDFNNILTGILSHIDLALFAEELPPSLAEYLNLAQASARRGAELVGKLATFSRRSEPKLRPVCLWKALEEVHTTLQRTLDARIKIHCVPSVPDTGWALADESQITQVIFNMCLNACESMPQGGDLTLEMIDVHLVDSPDHPGQHIGDYVRITVGDTGEGMPPEVYSRLFEPYFTTKSLGKGTGLGLSISYNIVRAHRGWMEVESQVGKGTRYHVFLPQARQGSTPIPPPPAVGRENPPDTSGRVPEGNEIILVVDDEELVRLVVRAVLAFRGYQIIEAASGEEAIEKIRQATQPINLALIDVHMDGLNGWDTLNQMRRHQPGLSAILLSGAPSEVEIDKASHLGNVSFLSKPFENHDLARLVRRLLDTPAKTSEQ